ncbi:Xanthine and CO dehydrogenase maturation factor, XdhC/CoxF family [Mucilaginibacter gossypiicola]|uniref:Xanthine and CO dehydrogenase maturation factor, XdhC/CoxF family n=1 Tax=Mucilaginibacter gossypiicola TaxID=551995 RepID=A0A1H8P388_9SPHI|nr:XdhC/CoxI family protein [Mucilaginibacter gossypiicola]SEO36254.1 Xanthine and CO dehydrogenase maturation factor, XdhC/CoxF family [Mucilaginibacter gossypiicola]
MKEIIDIVAAYDEAHALGKKTALATVVLVEGSAYRRAGARMLITEDGLLTGAISGGCLEGDALRKARLVIMQQQPLLVTYDTTDDDDAKLGVGLGCNGIIHILIEPITGDFNNPINLLKDIIANRCYSVLVTMFSVKDRKAPQPGTCLCLTGDKLTVTSPENAPYRSALIANAEQVLRQQRSEIQVYEAGVNYTAFIEYIKPVISLVIVGAGNDAVPLTRIASVLGWDITIIDGRANYAASQRFPLANRIITAKPAGVLQHIEINDRTAVVLMTHNYNYEIALLKEILQIQLPYIGILGPKKKLERMLAEIEGAGVVISEEQLSNIYGPVGLDIGAEGAEEIALSVASEIKAVLSSRQGYSLKYKPAPIHTSHIKYLI